MSELQSDIIAAKFRDEGDAFHRQNKSYKALVCYNKSLCFSESNEVKSLAFADRSAVYLESKKFQQCLDNIQLAREHGYPADKILDAREAKCKELMEQHRPDPREDPWNFFKLSYPANKKLPFIVDCLELKEDAKYGRHIITNRDLKAGDIIAIEDTYFKHLDLSYCYERCNNCLKANMLSLIPCKGRCVNTMFCSEKCAKAAESRHRQYECSVSIANLNPVKRLVFDSINIAGGIEELQACIEEHEKLTIFDIDMRNPDDPQVKKKQLMAFLALMPRRQNLTKERILLLATWFVFSFEICGQPLKRQLMEFLVLMLHPGQLRGEVISASAISLARVFSRLTRIKALNSYVFDSFFFSNEISDWKFVEIGETVSLFGALFNHSCDPNVRWVSVDNKRVAAIQVPIKAGQQLFVSYKKSYLTLPILLRDERRKMLLRDYQFHCDCNACHIDLKFDKLRFTDENFEFPTNWISVSPDPIKEFKKNCKYIEKNFKNHPCHETIWLIVCNEHLLAEIAQLGSFKQ